MCSELSTELPEMQVCKLLALAAALGAKGFANEAATPSTVFIEDLAVCWRDVLGLFHRNLCAKSVARRGAQTCPKDFRMLLSLTY